MMKEVRVKAYAKINLFLNITSVMDNGFHEIDSVMQTVSLADDLSVRVGKSETTEIKVLCESAYAPEGRENIVYRAAEVFLDRIGKTAKIEIELTKNIPSPAGMGGGSADAAAVLRALGEALGVGDTELLESIAAEIGSDVPFCVCGGTSSAGGRGERLTPCEPIADCFIVVGCGRDKMPTPKAFRMLDEKYDRFRYERNISSAENFLKTCGSPEKMGEALYNIFEEVTAEECPSVNKMKKEMLDGGALGALMSGSGPSVFGIFDHENKAKAVAEKIKKNGDFAAVCTPIKRYL
jgi:4-diphosphocytidyl-2-C-methyl-D-erythritol kinase